MTSPENPPQQVYRFAGYELDAAQRELRRDGAPVEIQPRVFELLVYLVRHRDRAVGKEELQDEVWTGMVVTEASLTRAVMKARRAVGDDSSAQSVIRTVHGHGYRFVAPLEEAPGPGPAAGASGAGPAEPDTGVEPGRAASRPAPEPAMPPPEQPARVSPRRRLLAGLAGLAVALGAWLLLWPPFPADAGGRVAVLPVANATGEADLEWVRLGLMSLAARLIETEGGVTVVPDAQLVQAVEGSEASGEPGEGLSSGLAERLRRGLGATHVVSGRLSREGGMLRLSYAVFNPEGEATRGTMVGEDPTLLARGMAQAAVTAVAGRARLRPETPAVSRDPFVNEAYARGMALSLEGRCGEARALFKVAMDQEPALFAPRYEYAVCTRVLGEQERAGEMLETLVEELRAGEPDRRLAMTLNTLGVVYNRTGRLDEGEAAETEALEIARQLGDAELAGNILLNLSIIAEDRGDLGLAAERLDRAILAYRESGREVPPGNVYSALANLALDQGELDTADANLEKALAAFRLVGDRRREAMMLNNQGYVRRLQGRLDEAETLHLRSYAMREELGDVMGMGRIRNMLATLYLARGDFGAAREAALDAVAAARETRDRLFEGTALSHLGSAELALGDTAAAEDAFLQSRAVFEDIQDRMRILMTDLRLARVALERGQSARAAATGGDVLEQAREAKLNLPEIEALELMGDAALARGATDVADTRYREALETVRGTSWASKETEIAVKLAGVYLERAALAEAEPLVGLVSRHPPTLDGLRLQARYAHARGDSAAAVRLMEEARALGDGRWSQQDETLAAEYREAAELAPQ